MILTEGAAKYAEGLEEIIKKDGMEPAELNEHEQVDLYTLMSVFNYDEVFRNYIRGCLHTFVEAQVHAGMLGCSYLMDLMVEVCDKMRERFPEKGAEK